MTIVARQFALMTEAGYDNLVTSCITSFGNYNEILETWREFPELEAKIREDLWKACRREFNKPKYIAHASDLVYKFRGEIAERARVPAGSPRHRGARSPRGRATMWSGAPRARPCASSSTSAATIRRCSPTRESAAPSTPACSAAWPRPGADR